MGKFEKTQYISVLNAVSAIAVVMLHTNGCFWNFSRERYWITANMIGSVLYFAVPVFFMISGATLIDYKKRYNTKTFFQKRIRKTVIPFIAWSFIGIIFCISKFGGNSIEISQVFPIELYSGVLQLEVVGGYMSYALIGYVLANVELENWKRYIIYIIGIVGLFVHIYGTQILSFAEGKIVQTFKGYNNVPCILYSIAIFLFLKRILIF